MTALKKAAKDANRTCIGMAASEISDLLGLRAR
jgi:hypothetical protein